MSATSRTAATAESASPPGGRVGRWNELGGIASVVALVLAYLSPALKDGGRFGSFDFVIPLTPLGNGLYKGAPFNTLNSDVVSQLSAWNAFDWRQVHAGHFPLWNDLSLLGLPHFLNFESAVLSLPDLVSYAVPLPFAFISAVAVKMLIAGIGTYVFSRVIGLRPLGASFAGISFMLSGAFANWLTWPLSDVLAWTGWIATFAVLAYRWPRRARWVVGLAVSVAFCLYGGFPEADVFVAFLLVLITVVFVARTLLAGRGLSLGGALRTAVGVAAGIVLSLPLWLPGAQVLSLAHRNTEKGFPGLPARSLSLLFAQGYYGLPTRKNPFFLTGFNYYESVSYVGAVMLVLALVAAVRWWRHPLVTGLCVACLATIVVCYQTKSFHVVQDFLNSLSGRVEWLRFRSVLGFPLGVLAGLGLETVRARSRERAVWLPLTIGTLGALVVVLELWRRAGGTAGGAAARSVRDRSLLWPAVLVLALVLAVALVRFLGARGRVLACAGLFAANCGFLLFAGVGINSYSHAFYPVSPAMAALARDVGSAVVGLDDGNASEVQDFVPVGVYPEVNLGYSFIEFAGHDPVLPQSYFEVLGNPQAKGGPGFFEPDIASAATARHFGIGYILARAGLPAPRGARFVADVAGEGLYKVPGAARASLVGQSGGRNPIAPLSHPSPSEYDFTLDGSGGALVVLHVTDVPGWHATLDGRAVALDRYGGVMMSFRLPSKLGAGPHSVRLWYWPARLTYGLAAALAAVLGLVAYGLFCWMSARRRRGGTADGIQEGA
ncbi:MAG: hypothetical protein ACRDZP_02360, partial [Acidimicrobiales bacterium]